MLVIAVRNINVCYANNENAKIINGTWVVVMDSTAQGGSRAVPLNTIEKRQYMSNQAIVKKFATRQRHINNVKGYINALESLKSGVPADLTSRLATAESKILQLQQNQVYIKNSILEKCKQLDNLLDPIQDCCKTDYVVICTSRTALNDDPAYTFPGGYEPKGTCPTCPAGLLNAHLSG